MTDQAPNHIDHFAPPRARRAARTQSRHAALGPEELDEPDTDVELADGHEIDGLSDPD